MYVHAYNKSSNLPQEIDWIANSAIQTARQIRPFLHRDDQCASAQHERCRATSHGTPRRRTVWHKLAKADLLLLPSQQKRVLSVRECARAQGFPDWYKFNSTHQIPAKIVEDVRFRPF